MYIHVCTLCSNINYIINFALAYALTLNAYTSCQVIFNKLYNKESEGGTGTLKQLQTAINCTNILSKVKDDPMAVEDFMDLTLDAHIVAAAMEFFWNARRDI